MLTGHLAKESSKERQLGKKTLDPATDLSYGSMMASEWLEASLGFDSWENYSKYCDVYGPVALLEDVDCL
jgi:hypothetical protein